MIVKRAFFFALLLVFLAACQGPGESPIAPPAPTNLDATYDEASNNVVLTWNESTGAASYNVYRSQTANFDVEDDTTTLVDSLVTDTTYTEDVATLAPGTYYYAVTAVNVAGQSEKSNEDSVDVSDGGNGEPTAPAAPMNLQATGSDSMVTLTWTASANATSYNVYRSATQNFTIGTENQIATNVTGTTYLDEDVINDTTYYYQVTAVNAQGESSASSEVGATPMAGVEPGPQLVALDFTEEVPGTLANTGFTLVQQGANVTDPFNPGNLTLDPSAGTLTINAQPGLQFTTSNSLENGLGVAVDATTEARVIEVEFVKPAFPGNFFQQAGLWFGQPGNQGNYVKLIVQSDSTNETGSRIVLTREINDVAPAANAEGDLRTGNFSIATGAIVTLRLVVMPDGMAMASYAINGGAMTELGTVALTGADFDLVTEGSAAGIMASRRGDTGGSLSVVFNRFTVSAVAAE